MWEQVGCCEDGERCTLMAGSLVVCSSRMGAHAPHAAATGCKALKGAGPAIRQHTHIAARIDNAMGAA